LDDAKVTGDLGDDLTDDLILNEKNVGHLAIKPIGPNVCAGLGFDGLRHDADAVVGAPDAAPEHIAHPEIVSELGDVYGLALVLKSSVAREHAKVVRRPRQFGHQVLSQPSLKYSCFGSSLRLVKGRTAIAGPSGMPRTGRSAAPSGAGPQRSRVSHAPTAPSTRISAKTGRVVCQRVRRFETLLTCCSPCRNSIRGAYVPFGRS